MTNIELPNTVRSARFSVRFARNREEVLETQRLRYRIFAQEMGAQIDGGVDQDRYDPFCRHLLVRDEAQNRLVACTRILTDERARDAGGFYSEHEFELNLLDSLPGRVLEVGRTCVDAEYRGGAAIATLWSGLAGYVTQNG
ncbi:MAG: GNAT family N-acetyltransferase, partial [Hydrocarboniphaga effusa]|nr:GNAT family N-acetyltransferase [Hydrocarboniphaga effusa]